MFGRDKWKPTSKCCLYFNKGIQRPSGIFEWYVNNLICSRLKSVICLGFWEVS